MRFAISFTSPSTAASVASSPSAFASAKSSPESRSPASILSSVWTVSSSARRSLPRSWARFASDQMFGSSRMRATSISRDLRVS
jgi:hypothetical protein